MSAPFLTFLIPTYNRASLLTGAIESVLADDVADRRLFEIVVVDDGSTDDTAARIAHWVDAGAIRYLRMPENRGSAVARNTGIEAARGKWIAYLDSDNRLLPGVMSLLIAELGTVPDSCGVFWGNCRDPEGNTTTTHGVTGVVPGTHLVEGRYAGEHFSVVRTTLARKHRYAEFGTRNECTACFWYPIALESDLYLSPGIFQYYETEGADRLTSVESRRYRSHELIRCFEETLSRFGPILERRAPEGLLGTAWPRRLLSGDRRRMATVGARRLSCCTGLAGRAHESWRTRHLSRRPMGGADGPHEAPTVNAEDGLGDEGNSRPRP